MGYYQNIREENRLHRERQAHKSPLRRGVEHWLGLCLLTLASALLWAITLWPLVQIVRATLR
jgi:hypothetical protein